MAVLAFDTSAGVSVAIVDHDGRVVVERSSAARRRHAETLMPLIMEVCQHAEIRVADATMVAVGTGPAPFTGLRVGLVTAEALAFAVGIPVVGVCSLDALALQGAHELGLVAGAELVATSDARRREIYWAHYRVLGTGDAMTVQQLDGPHVTQPTAVHGLGLPVIGEGISLYPPEPSANPGPHAVSAGTLGALALARHRAGFTQPTTPLYLRRPDVHVPTTRKRVSDGAPFTVEVTP